MSLDRTLFEIAQRAFRSGDLAPLIEALKQARRDRARAKVESLRGK